jgi:hypothetical protein
VREGVYFVEVRTIWMDAFLLVEREREREEGRNRKRENAHSFGGPLNWKVF